MRLLLSLFLALIGTIAVSAQINATVYPSETYEMEHLVDYSYNACPYFFTKNLNTGKAQRLAFSAYNPSVEPISLSFTCENPADDFKEHISFWLQPYHQSDRYEFISTGMMNYSYCWDTQLVVSWPHGFDFYAYWIYQVLNL